MKYFPDPIEPQSLASGVLVTYDADGDSLTWHCDSMLITSDGNAHIKRLGETVITLGPDEMTDFKWVHGDQK